MICLTLKDKDNVYLASASAGYTLPSCCHLEVNQPIWAPKGITNTLVCYQGSSFCLNALRFNKPLMDAKSLQEEGLSSWYIINHILPNAIHNLRLAKVISDDTPIDKIWGGMYVANNSKAFRMDPYGLVKEIEDFDAIGPNFERCYAVLDYLKDCKDSIYRILKALSITLELEGCGAYPIIIRNTNHPKDVKSYSMMDAMLYIHNYEEEVKHASRSQKQ